MRRKKENEDMHWPLQAWDWWRNHHNMNRWEAFRYTFRSDVIEPINKIYSWLWLKTYWKWIGMPKIRRLSEECRKLEEKQFGRQLGLKKKDDI